MSDTKVWFTVPKDELDRYLEGTHGVVDATSFEKMKLWQESKEWDRVWEHQGMGHAVTLGYLDDMPVCLSFIYNWVNGKKILFIECTSVVVDYRMIDKWLEENMPATARNERGYINRENAMNFPCVLR